MAVRPQRKHPFLELVDTIDTWILAQPAMRDKHLFRCHRIFFIAHGSKPCKYNGMKLKNWRKSQNLRLTDAAALVGCSPSTLSRLENDKQGFSRKLLQKIHQVTGGEVTPTDFLDA